MTERWDLGCIQKGKESASTGCWGCVSCCNVCCTQDMAQGMHGSRDAAASWPCPAGLTGQEQRPPALPAAQGLPLGMQQPEEADQQSAAPLPAHPSHRLGQISLLPSLVLLPQACGIQGKSSGSCVCLHPYTFPCHSHSQPWGTQNKGCSWSLNPWEQLTDILLYSTTAQHSQHRPPPAPAPSSPQHNRGTTQNPGQSD